MWTSPRRPVWETWASTSATPSWAASTASALPPRLLALRELRVRTSPAVASLARVGGCGRSLLAPRVASWQLPLCACHVDPASPKACYSTWCPWRAHERCCARLFVQRVRLLWRPPAAASPARGWRCNELGMLWQPAPGLQGWCQAGQLSSAQRESDRARALRCAAPRQDGPPKPPLRAG